MSPIQKRKLPSFMQTWPSPHRLANSSTQSSSKDKKFVERNYPVLDHGAVEAVTLVQRNGRFEWDSLVSARPTVKRFCASKVLNVFPVTKSPPLPESTAMVNQRADHGAHFLRTQFPEVDISADVIRNQIMEDSLQASELAKFDPFEGNVLDIVAGHDKTMRLVFPTGELSAELNLTPIVEDVNGTVIKPTTTPVRTFSTPIQQITSSHPFLADEPTQRDTLIGVRTFGATSLLKLDPEATRTGGVQDLTYFTSHDVGGASIIDLKVTSVVASFGALLANKKGAVYGCSLTSGKKTMVKLYAGSDPPPTSPFWRLAQQPRHPGCLLLSGKALDQLDFRSNEAAPLYTEISKDFLTSSEDYAQDGLIRLCSTSQIIWLDPRYAGKPLLGYKHYRQFDRTLQTSTFFVDGSPATFLSSRRNSMLTIYNVSRHRDELLRAIDSPYGVLPCGGYRRYTGQAFLQHDSPTITVFRADERAGVDCAQLRTQAGNEQEHIGLVVIEESDAIKEFKKRANNMKTDSDILGDQGKMVTNLFPAYDRVFRIHTEQQEKVEEEQAEVFYDIMDRLPAFWQTCENPSEHMLTSYDVVFRSHEDPEKSSRSDFTTGSLFSSARGFRAVSQNRFPIEQLRKGAPWHINIVDIQNCIDPTVELSNNARELAESLRSYGLVKDDDRTALSLRRENNAREQLTVDLMLSGDIYSPSAFISSREAGDDLETMTEALSLSGHDTDEPPEVEFGCLAPVIRGKGKKKDHYYSGQKREEEGIEEEPTGGKVTLPLGVRLLLKDWEVGTKAEDYIFQDPYNTIGDSGPRHTVHPAMQRLRPANTMPSMLQVMNSQRPPAVMPSQTQASGWGSANQDPTTMVVQPQFLTVQQTGTFATQPLQQLGAELSQPQASQANSSPQTEQYVASTQVLPGPHGGRPSLTKKKPQKKRLGGF